MVIFSKYEVQENDMFFKSLYSNLADVYFPVLCCNFFS